MVTGDYAITTPSGSALPAALFVFLAATARTRIVSSDARCRFHRLLLRPEVREELAHVTAEPRTLGLLPFVGRRIIRFAGERAHHAKARHALFVGEPASMELRASNVAAAVFGDRAHV